MNSKNTYIGFAVVIAASIAAASLFRFSAIIQDLAAIPAILALFAALFQLGRDRIAHERSLLVLQSQNAFAIGATSHMAGVVFDKYASFCEEYGAEMFNTLTTLAREGPRKSALEHANNLLAIRRTWAVWLTPEIDEKLAPLEKELRIIGSEAWTHEQAPGHADSAAMFSAFAKVIGLEAWQGERLTDDLTVTAMIGQLRRVLGTEELSRLRSELVARALRNVGSSEKSGVSAE